MPKDFNKEKVEHIPVLLHEVLSAFSIKPGKKYIDATFGFGGHAQEMVRLGGIVLGIEKDEETIRAAKKNLHLSESEKKNLTIVHGSYENITSIAASNGFGTVSGILFDLGFSSWQLDKSGRGFRFSGNEKLDMRFEPLLQTKTAAELINRSSRERLEEVLTRYAEEEQSRTIADALYRARPITTNSALLSVLDGIFGSRSRRRTARIFQAFRIAVNDELSALKSALPKAKELIESGGVLAVISFHSLEDRIVKRFMKQQEETAFELMPKTPIRASAEEMLSNPRSKSAKLRIARKL